MTGIKSIEYALDDIKRGLTSHTVWRMMAWEDIRRRYRRSLIGPFWITISMSVLIGGLGYLFGVLFKMEMNEYFPFLAAGLILWTYITSLINESTSSFVESSHLVKQIRIPWSFFVFRMIYRNIIILIHNFTIFILVAIYFKVDFGFSTLLVIPGFILVTLNSVWFILLFGALGARYRDLGPILASITQLLFYLTPIIWQPELMVAKGRVIFLDLNPFYHIIEVVRAPLLGQVPSGLSWLVAAGMIPVGSALCLLVFSRIRYRIIYWV